MEHLTNYQERTTHDITPAEQMQFVKKLLVCMILIDISSNAYHIQNLQKAIQQHILYLRYPTTSVVGHIRDN